ncbi:MAG: hypothetical protein OZ921_09620 [Sorangiineae bacterium]|nr:hypothetical protein [Polyangiaceae bacterium]MEB2322762.1 hypothetical protein [Sorangiineae bacterium]
MERTARSQRLGAALAALGLLVLAACERASPPDEPPRRAAALPAGSAPASAAELAALLGDAAAADGGGRLEAERTVTALRERGLRVPPRRVAAERLAFSGARLAQLAADALVLRDAKSGAELARLPVDAPRSVVASIDGGFIVAAESAVYRLDPKAKALARLPRVTLFPESALFADRREPSAFWVLHTIDPTLYRYDVPDGAVPALLAPADFVSLPGYAGGAFAALADGSFAYATSRGLERVFPKGKERDYGASEGGAVVWRLLAARRQDQVWAILADGRAELVDLSGPRQRVVRRLALGSTPFDVASSDDTLAVVRVVEAAGAPRRWHLDVYDASGEKRLEAPLPPDPPISAGDDWVRRVTSDRSVVLAPKATEVAVGGPGSLALWDVKTGRAILPSR